MRLPLAIMAIVMGTILAQVFAVSSAKSQVSFSCCYSFKCPSLKVHRSQLWWQAGLGASVWVVMGGCGCRMWRISGTTGLLWGTGKYKQGEWHVPFLLEAGSGNRPDLKYFYVYLDSVGMSLLTWCEGGSFCFILLTHEGSHREVYQEFQPSYDIFHRWCQGMFRPQVPCTPSPHCQPIANSASTQSQQPV